MVQDMFVNVQHLIQDVDVKLTRLVLLHVHIIRITARIMDNVWFLTMLLLVFVSMVILDRLVWIE